ncbi:hypothetical protein ACIRBX_04760 [Kitasatospora sp. NPDC096147]|uniref:hypothetical protein n=1 Tax=Kitasatospora sp. NPDC096147 TaxID=3364093 RepID=UPI00383067E5
MTTPEPRPDLLALTPDTLAALTNRGLVKRAARELESGAGPAVSVAGDGGVTGHHPDGSTSTLPAGHGLDAATCSCAAPGVCRHLLALVLAYQQRLPAPAAPELLWSPAEFDDAQLESALGSPALAAARRTLARGPQRATVHPAGPDRPAPWVELPSCTVRFPVPHGLGYALSDAAARLHGETVVLAVWAFRAAEAAPTSTRVVLGPPAPSPPSAATTPADALATALDLATELLLDGPARTTPVFAAQLQRVSSRLTAEALHWPAAVLTDLHRQTEAHAARDARYSPAELASLLAELSARGRAAALDPAGALGSREAADTPLRLARLVSLGCRVTGPTPETRTATLYFAHPDAGLALVLRKHWPLADGQPVTGPELAGRRLLGTTLRALASGNLVSEQLSRSPGRAVTIGRGRISATTVTPLGAAWTTLPAPLLVHDLTAHLHGTAHRPPRLIRPRVEAEDALVLAVGAVESVGYDPARQQFEAVLRDPSGAAVLLRADHEPACPGRLDALAGVLATGRVTHVSGLLRYDSGHPVLDPLALLTPDGPTVPDLVPTTAVVLPPLPDRPADPLAQALESALAALADLAHTGLRHTRHPDLSPASAHLRRAGLHTAAALLDALATDTTPTAWTDAALHLHLALELHHLS